MHQTKYFSRLAFLFALFFPLSILAANVQELTSGIAKPSIPIPGAEHVGDASISDPLQGKMNVDKVMDSLDPCVKIYDKLNGLRSCPADVGRNCVGVSISLVVEDKKCVLHALDANNSASVSSGREIGDFYGIHTGGITDLGKLFWSTTNNFALDVIIDPANRFLDANSYILKKPDHSEVRIAFAEIQYQSTLEKQDVNNSGLKIPSNLAAAARDAVERAVAECKADFLCAQSKGRVRVENFKEHLQDVIREGTLVAAGNTLPSVDPGMMPPPDDDISDIGQSEASGSSGGCTLYPHLPVTGWWAGVGGFIILIVMMILTRRLARSKSRRRR